ncbi:DAK2 domain-containing protein [Streptomyces albidoflavus]
MRRFAESAHATETRLTSLDQQVGDGDFGTNLTAGADAALRRLDRLPGGDTDPAAPLEAAATAFLDEVGGTSGPPRTGRGPRRGPGCRTRVPGRRR